jgi:hypothetical protein
MAVTFVPSRYFLAFPRSYDMIQEAPRDHARNSSRALFSNIPHFTE